MKITLCSSASFFDKLDSVRVILENRGYIIFFPHVWNWNEKSEEEISKVQHDLIKRHFKNIDESDALYVANYEKNGTSGYIGGSVLLEMGKAFDKGIPIFLMYDVPQDVKYREELLALQPIVIGENWEKLDMVIKSCSNSYTAHRK